MDESGGAGELELVRAGRDGNASEPVRRTAAAADERAATLASSGTVPLVALRGVGHTYRSIFGKRTRAVENFSLDIQEGEVLGLAGPNGAGKSTLISLMLGFIQPTDGELRLDGQPPRQFVERHGVGYLSELISMPPRWKLEHTLQRYGTLAGLDDAELHSRVDLAIATLGLEEHRGKQVRQLSKGNLQRVGLAQALLREDRILILDEPTHGLDPVWTQKFRDVVVGLRRPNRAIFIASHNLDELQRLCDRVAIIDHGELQRVVDMRAPQSRVSLSPYSLSVSAPEGVDAGAEVRRTFPDARVGEAGSWEIGPLPLPALNEGMVALIGRGVLVASVSPAHTALEQQFREAVGQ